MESWRRPDFGLAGRTVMVTGAGRGLGKACALACAAAGADIVAGVRDARAGAEVVREVEALGRRGFSVEMEITAAPSVDRAVAEALGAFGQIDVLVNNVGISRQGPAEAMSEEDFDAIVATNLKGTYLVTRAVATGMLDRGSGRIINMSSQAGTVTLRGEAIYCMTKAAINHLTRCLAAEWGPRGVAVNSVSPTFIWTDSTRPYLNVAENYERTVAHIPLGRIGDVEDVTGAVIYLASPAGRLVNGANLLVDGGWSVA